MTMPGITLHGIAYISASPFLFQNHYGLNAFQVGLCFGMNAFFIGLPPSQPVSVPPVPSKKRRQPHHHQTGLSS